MKSSQRLYRTLAGDIVPEGDTRAAFLVVNEGGEAPDEYTSKVRAFLSDHDDEAPAESTVEADAAEEKQADKPVNKAVAKTPNKGR